MLQAAAGKIAGDCRKQFPTVSRAVVPVSLRLVALAEWCAGLSLPWLRILGSVAVSYTHLTLPTICSV
eukprot:6061997-Alexandrium_andersonii.AAC.1